MSAFPPAVLDFLSAIVIGSRSPAYLFVERNGRLSSWGGALERYGIADLQKGEQIGAQIAFLNGLLPLDETPFFLPCVKTESSLSADIHIFSGDEGDWVILLDATPIEAARGLLQQKTNDLSLLRSRQAKILDRYLGKNTADDLAQEIISFQEKGKRCTVTFLFADLRGFNSYSEKSPPEQVIKILGLYLDAMISPVIDEAGIIDKIIGDAVMAIFGALSSTVPAPQQAVKAAFRILESVRDVNRACQATFEIGIGISTGQAILGILGSKDRKYLNAIGRPAGLAARLENQACPGEILIDEDSFNQIGAFRDSFSASPNRIYSCLVK